MIDSEEQEEKTSYSEDLEKSFIVADIGTVNTTAVLIDTVAGHYRLVARASVQTTARLPWLDASKGVQQAITRISEITGRALLNERGILIRPPRKDGSGIDDFAVVVSAPSPLRTVLVGLYDEMSIASLRKALRSVYTEEVDVLSLADTRQDEEQIAAVIHHHPDLIAITGGTDGGAEERLRHLIDVAGIATAVLAEGEKPHVIYAGNVRLREQVRSLIEPYAHLHIADNVRPQLTSEKLDDVIRMTSEIYEDIKIQNLPGMHELSEWASYPMLPAATSFATVCHYLAALHKQRVLGVDLGSNHTVLVLADAQKVQLAVRPELGMGEPAANLLQKVSAETIMQWIPDEVEAADVANYVYNKSAHPQTIPMTEDELQMEQAMAREMLRCALGQTAVEWGYGKKGSLPTFDHLLVHGATLANMPRPGQTMLLLLDALQPVGVFAVSLDQYGVLPPLGALATHQPLAVVQALEAGVLSELGWVIALAGKGSPGKKAIDISIESAQGRYDGDVKFGQIEVIPVAPGQEAKVTVKPASRFDIGYGPGQGTTITLRGGAVGGLVIDARGRPLSLPRDEADRHSLVRKWHWDLGG